MIRALGATYERHRERLQAVASRYTVQDAEDIVHDAFVRALQHRARFRHRAALSTWVHRIVVNECITRYRKLQRRESADRLRLSEGVESTRGISAEAFDIRAALRALPRHEYRVLVLHEIMGHTHEEIGAFLKISAGTSKNWLYTARRRLRASVAARAV
jgi:RNA polymerase sigma-70 factor (ECF subfamily)